MLHVEINWNSGFHRE